jgi:uroporphyrinogen decarboxylase
LTSKERTLAALGGEKPDLIPIQMDNFLLCAELSGRSYGEVFGDPRLLAESQLDTQRLFLHDIIDIETGVATLAEACGCEVEHPPDAAPWVVKGLFQDMPPSEVERRLADSELPVPSRSRSLRVMTDAVGILAAEAGNEVFIKAEADQGPFNLAAQLRGMDRFLMDIVDGEGYVPALLEYTSAACAAYARALIEAGADAVVIGESFAGPDVVSPRTYESLALVYERKAFDAIRGGPSRDGLTPGGAASGALISLHICGNVNRIIGRMVGSGADMLEIDEKTDLEAASREAAGKTCLVGAVSPRILRNGTPREIREEIKRVIDALKGNSRFVLSPGCSIAGDTPVGNVTAFVEAGRELGAYP